MFNINDLETMKIKELEENYPFVLSFFENNKLNPIGFETLTFPQYLNRFTEEDIGEWAIDVEKLKQDLVIFINQMLEFLGVKDQDEVETLTIIAGQDKDGKKEQFDTITIKKGEIISIVGPTGSGKSRLLADIEWVANNDTPTSRSILINDRIPDKKWRYTIGNKLVAQLSQNMNFVMDLTVGEFVELHAKSRMVENESEVVTRIIDAANYLSGEQFDLNTPITSLSGGQSRALMIADTAILSASPIVLIDEIENAGIDRKKALNLLVGEEKIVLMATHDPSLALMANKRIIIKNGGVYKIIETNPQEKNILKELEKMDAFINAMRLRLRKGELLTIE